MNSLKCTVCSQKYSFEDPRWRCECGRPLDIEFTPRFHLGRIDSRPPGMWRYREAIPIVSDDHIVSFSEGYTPLVEADVSGFRVKLKLDFLFPTGSFKDRGASVLLSRAKELRIGSVIEDSSGNAGAAVAAYSAKAGISCCIYVPSITSNAKTSQIEAYGASVIRVEGSREQTAESALKAAESTWYASHAWNPFFFQGTKTVAYELCEQMGWKAPDTVVAPVGNGTLLLGAYMGFRELAEAGVTGSIPRMIGVQAALCAPLHAGFRGGADSAPCPGTQKTVASGIAVAAPVRGEQIIKAVAESGGRFITVEEFEIIMSFKDMARKGLFIEPTAAAGIAGLRKYLVDANDGENVVAILTGHGLKSPEVPMLLE